MGPNRLELVVPDVKHIPHWVSVPDYARLCGIHPRSAYQRIKRGVVSHFKVQGIEVVDMLLSPPKRRVRTDAPKAPPFVWHPEIPPADSLMAAWEFCHRNKMRGHAFYRAMLLGKVKGWVIGDQLFVERTLDPSLFLRKPAEKPPRKYRRYRRY